MPILGSSTVLLLSLLSLAVDMDLFRRNSKQKSTPPTLDLSKSWAECAEIDLQYHQYDDSETVVAKVDEERRPFKVPNDYAQIQQETHPFLCLTLPSRYASVNDVQRWVYRTLTWEKYGMYPLWPLAWTHPEVIQRVVQEWKMNGRQLRYLPNHHVLDPNLQESDNEEALEEEPDPDAKALEVIYDILWYEVCMSRGQVGNTRAACGRLLKSWTELRKSEARTYEPVKEFCRADSQTSKNPHYGAVTTITHLIVDTKTNTNTNTKATKKEPKPKSPGGSGNKSRRLNDALKALKRLGRRSSESVTRPSAESNTNDGPELQPNTRPFSYASTSTDDQTDKRISYVSIWS